MKLKTWALLASSLKQNWKYTDWKHTNWQSTTHAPVLCQPIHKIRSERPYSLAVHSTLPVNDVLLQSASYTLAHGASGYAKNRSYVTPDIKKREHYCSVQIGEDAYFRRSDAIGVADGVGGWSNVKNSNPALYSRKLMHHAYLELEKFENIEDPYFQKYEEANPLDVLQRSYEKSMLEMKKEGIMGSSTACLAILRHAELRIANLGDCGISVIRHHNYIFQSEEQQHSFNFPFQLGSKSPDRPRDAQSFTVRVQKGDIIIMGSDGLFDNLFDKDILSTVQALVSPQAMSDRFMPIKPQIISDALAKKAKAASQTELESPFQNKATNEGIYYQGGKADDISVVVAIVQDSESVPDRRL